MNTERLAGRVAIVTGGGIGAAVAKKLRLPGYSRSAGILIFVDIYALSLKLPCCALNFSLCVLFLCSPKRFETDALGEASVSWGGWRKEYSICGS